MIFQFVQKNEEILGISRTQPSYVFYVKALMSHLVLSNAVISHFKYLFRGDLAFEEYMQSFFMTAVTVICSLCYERMILQIEKVYELIDMLEATIHLFGESGSKFSKNIHI